MCGPEDRNRFGRRSRMHGEPVDGCFGGGRFQRPESPYERRGDCRPPEQHYRRGQPYENECCCDEGGDMPEMLSDLAQRLDCMVDEVMGDLVREKIMCALEERLGDKLERLVEAVVDSHIEDLEELLRGAKARKPDLVEKFARIILEDYENADGEGECCSSACCENAKEDGDGEKKDRK